MASEFTSAIERVLEEVLVNERIKVDGDWLKIVDVQYMPKINTILYRFTNGEEMSEHEDTILEFEKDVARPRIKPNRKIKKG